MRVFITGAPATGKTTAAQGLIDQLGHTARCFSIGQYVFNEAKRRQPDLTYERLRSEASTAAPPEVVEAAVEALCADLDNWEGQLAVVESHAVVDVPPAIRVTPFVPKHLKSLSFDVICLLEIPYGEYKVRVKVRNGREMDELTFAAVATLQREVAVAYCVLTGATLFRIDGSPSKNEVRSSIAKAIDQDSIQPDVRN